MQASILEQLVSEGRPSLGLSEVKKKPDNDDPEILREGGNKPCNFHYTGLELLSNTALYVIFLNY